MQRVMHEMGALSKPKITVWLGEKAWHAGSPDNRAHGDTASARRRSQITVDAIIAMHIISAKAAKSVSGNQRIDAICAPIIGYNIQPLAMIWPSLNCVGNIRGNAVTTAAGSHFCFKQAGKVGTRQAGIG